jgi:uncharacterized protein
MEYVRRAVDDALDELLPELPAILLDGPKAVGKTTTALQRAKSTKKLYLQQDLDRAALRPSWLVEGEKPILLDEWQKLPQSWELVKERVDQDYSGGQFLLTGSLPQIGAHSGAGRITSLRMRPLGLSERAVEPQTVSFGSLMAGNVEVSGSTAFSSEQYAAEIARSGFFGIRSKTGNALRVTLDGYLQRVIDTDVRELGLNVRRPATLAAWLRAYAAATATVAKWEIIRDAATSGSEGPPTKATSLPYRDTLTRLRILDELPAWIPSRNHFTRVGSASKHYLADPALALALLDVSAEQLIGEVGFRPTGFDKPLFGRMFEALAALTVRNLAEAKFAKVMHFRDSKGNHEVDLIVQRPDGKILAIETKLSETVSPSDFKHLHWLSDELGDDLVGKVVLYAGKDAYTAQGVSVVPLALLGS